MCLVVFNVHSALQDSLEEPIIGHRETSLQSENPPLPATQEGFQLLCHHWLHFTLPPLKLHPNCDGPNMGLL